MQSVGSGGQPVDCETRVTAVQHPGHGADVTVLVIVGQPVWQPGHRPVFVLVRVVGQSKLGHGSVTNSVSALKHCSGGEHSNCGQILGCVVTVAVKHLVLVLVLVLMGSAETQTLETEVN